MSPTHRETATIYQFPASGRPKRNTRPAHPPPTPLQKIVWDSGWYHDAAVQEEYATTPTRPPRHFTDRG